LNRFAYFVQQGNTHQNGEANVQQNQQNVDDQDQNDNHNQNPEPLTPAERALQEKEVAGLKENIRRLLLELITEAVWHESLPRYFWLNALSGSTASNLTSSIIILARAFETQNSEPILFNIISAVTTNCMCEFGI
jgi:hypothetical protein